MVKAQEMFLLDTIIVYQFDALDSKSTSLFSKKESLIDNYVLEIAINSDTFVESNGGMRISLRDTINLRVSFNNGSFNFRVNPTSYCKKARSINISLTLDMENLNKSGVMIMDNSATCGDSYRISGNEKGAMTFHRAYITNSD